MSAVLDFSDDFRPDPRLKTTRAPKPLAQIVDEKMGVEKENFTASTRNTESASSTGANNYNISKHIGSFASSIGLSVNIDSIPPDILLCFERAIQEGDRARFQVQELLDENQSTHTRCLQLEKEQERLKTVIEATHQEVASHANRITALQAEHREMRNHWMCEKNELEAKYFQIQALLTQTKAATIKKEKGATKLFEICKLL